MGQTSLQILNRTGSKSFWNNSWDNKFLYQNFFLKFLILEKIIHILVNRKRFSTPKPKLIVKPKLSTSKFKNFLKDKRKVNGVDSIENYHEDICKSKLWVFKYHNWIILCIFILSPYKSHKSNKEIEMPIEFLSKRKVFKDFFFKDYDSYILKRKRFFRRRFWKKSVRKHRKKKRGRRSKVRWARINNKKKKKEIWILQN